MKHPQGSRTILPENVDVYNEKIEELNISIKERISIKKGGDYFLPDGTLIPNEELTLPPEKPRSFAFCNI